MTEIGHPSGSLCTVVFALVLLAWKVQGRRGGDGIITADMPQLQTTIRNGGRGSLQMMAGHIDASSRRRRRRSSRLRRMACPFNFEIAATNTPLEISHVAQMTCSVSTTTAAIKEAFFGRHRRTETASNTQNLVNVMEPESNRFSVHVASNTTSVWHLQLNVTLVLDDNNWFFLCGVIAVADAQVCWSRAVPFDPASIPTTIAAASTAATTTLTTLPNTTTTSTSNTTATVTITSTDSFSTSFMNETAHPSDSESPSSVTVVALTTGGRESSNNDQDLLYVAYIGSPVLLVACVYVVIVVHRRTGRRQQHNMAAENDITVQVCQYTEDQNVEDWPADFSEARVNDNEQTDVIYDESVLRSGDGGARSVTLTATSRNTSAIPNQLMTPTVVVNDDPSGGYGDSRSWSVPKYEGRVASFTEDDVQLSVPSNKISESDDFSLCPSYSEAQENSRLGSRHWSVGSTRSLAEDDVANAGWMLPDEDDHQIGEWCDNSKPDDGIQEEETAIDIVKKCSSSDELALPNDTPLASQRPNPDQIPYPDSCVYEELIHARKFKELGVDDQAIGANRGDSKTEAIMQEEEEAVKHVPPAGDFTIYDEVDINKVKSKTKGAGEKSEPKNRKARKTKSKSTDGDEPVPEVKRRYSVVKKMRLKVKKTDEDDDTTITGTDNRLLASPMCSMRGSPNPSCLNLELSQSKMTMCPGGDIMPEERIRRSSCLSQGGERHVTGSNDGEEPVYGECTTPPQLPVRRKGSAKIELTGSEINF